jgi:hypothetical protein
MRLKIVGSSHSVFVNVGSIVVCVLLLLFSNGYAAGKGSAPLAEFDAAEMQRLGQRMYREGLLPDGSSLRGTIRGDVLIDSTMFSCANCHSRSGLGSIEGQVVSPPVNGKGLFNPRYIYKDHIKNVISQSKGVPRTAQPIRSAYTDESLANAIRAGINPDGRELLPIMPRYDLEDRDVRVLIHYLKSLSSEYSPGATDTTLHLATIITDDVSAADREAMLAPLETMVTINKQTKTQQKLPQFAKMFRMLDRVYFRDITLAKWELKGPSETWRVQLEEYYRSGPVFAILGGISGGSWQPIHDFCEERRIPCLFPITDLPVISETSWYTFYASKGFYQEGETAARFLAGREALPRGKKVLQIVRSGRESEALASGFNEAWKEVGSGALETIQLVPDQLLSARDLKALLQQHQPATVVLWAGPDVIATLEAVAAEPALPDFIVSSRYLGKSIVTIPEEVREKTYITYPYRMPEDEKIFAGYANVLSSGRQKHKDEKRITSRSFSMVHMFLQGLKELRLDFYRDTLIDVISMQPDQYLPDFERYSFGLGQRYASKGCYIVQLSKGPNAHLVKKSDWVVF